MLRQCGSYFVAYPREEKHQTKYHYEGINARKT